MLFLLELDYTFMKLLFYFFGLFTMDSLFFFEKQILTGIQCGCYATNSCRYGFRSTLFLGTGMKFATVPYQNIKLFVITPILLCKAPPTGPQHFCCATISGCYCWPSNSPFESSTEPLTFVVLCCPYKIFIVLWFAICDRLLLLHCWVITVFHGIKFIGLR